MRLPVLTPVATLGPGEVGYLIAGIKDVGEAKVGETVTDAARRAEALAGYREPKPMVFCGLYPVEGDEYADLREALERLRLNDSSFTYEPETSGALGFGFRCGFLGLLHMEIVRERLEREYNLSLVASSPNVEYRLRAHRRHDRGRRQPVGDAVAAGDRSDRGAVRPHDDPDAERVRRHADGAVAGSGAARWRRWSTSPRTASSSSTCCRSRRSSSTSSTR